MLSIDLLHSHRLRVLQGVAGDQGAVLHMCLTQHGVVAEAGELSDEGGSEVAVILRPVSVRRRQDAQLDQLRIGNEVEGIDIRPRLLDAGVVLPQVGARDAGEELPRAVTDDLVEVGV